MEEDVFDRGLFDRVIRLLQYSGEEEKREIVVEFAYGVLQGDPDWRFLDYEIVQGILDQIEQLNDTSAVFSRLKACFIMGNAFVQNILRDIFLEARNEAVVRFLADLEKCLLEKRIVVDP